jgi:hypothetical protein
MIDYKVRRAPATAARLARQRRTLRAARQPDEVVPLGSYVRLVRRHRRALALAAAIGLGIGLASAATPAPTWVSGATVLAPAIAMDPQTPPSKVVRPRLAGTLDTELAILLSRRVRERAVVGTDVTPEELYRATSVTAVPNSRVLRVQVTDSDPDRARLLVTGLTDAYLDERTQLLTSRRSVQVEAIRREVDALTEQAGIIDKSAQLVSGTAADDAFKEADQAVAERLRLLNARLTQLQSNGIVPGELLRSATTPRKVATQPEVPVLSWVLLGLGVGGALIALRRRFPRPPRTAAEMSELPVLHNLPVAIQDDSGRKGQSGWVRMADAVGPTASAVLVVPVDAARNPLAATTALTVNLRRRGYSVTPMVGLDHDDPGPHGALSAMARVRSSGRHVVGTGPHVDELRRSVSASQADGVVLLATPPSDSRRDVAVAAEQVVRLGVPVLGVIIDRSALRRFPRRLHPAGLLSIPRPARRRGDSVDSAKNSANGAKAGER